MSRASAQILIYIAIFKNRVIRNANLYTGGHTTLQSEYVLL